MQLAEILISLYSGNSPSIYSIMNKSVYITEITTEENPILFHTGFRFQTHKKTPIDLYFELKSNTVVHQTVPNYYRKVPQIIGYLCSKRENKYIDTGSVSLVTGLNIQDATTDIYNQLIFHDLDSPESLITRRSEIKKVVVLSDKGRKKNHSFFKIIESPKKQTNLPLQTLFSEFVYYDGITFSKYQPEFNLYRNSFDDNDNKSEYWNCDACGGNSNTGCMSSTGDCYR